MYVCVCKSITDREIRGAVALGARTLADLQEKLGVASCCGRCAECAEEMLGSTPADAALHAIGAD